MQLIQILIAQKEKTFSKFFSIFLKSTLSFEHVKKKDDPLRKCIYKISDSAKSE